MGRYRAPWVNFARHEKNRVRVRCSLFDPVEATPVSHYLDQVAAELLMLHLTILNTLILLPF